MPLMDEFKEERDKIKNQPLKKRLAYFWSYYKWHTIGIIIAVAVVTSIVHDIASQKKYALLGIMVNGYVLGDEEAFLAGFCESAQIDPEKTPVEINSSFRLSPEMTDEGVSTQQYIMVHLAAHDLDIALMDPYCFNQYAYLDSFCDLRELLTPELYRKLADENRIFYVDRIFLDKLSELRAQGNPALLTEISYPAYDSPEDLEMPIPVGIDFAGLTKTENVYFFKTEDCYAGVFATSKNMGTAVKFLEYLLSD